MPIQIIIEVENYDELSQAFAAFGYVKMGAHTALVHEETSAFAVPETKPEPAVAVPAAATEPAPIEKKPRRKRRTKAEMEAARAEASKGNGEVKEKVAAVPAQPAPAPEAEALPSLEDIRALLKELAPTHLQECAEVLAQFDVTKSSDLDPQHYDAVHTKLSALQS